MAKALATVAILGSTLGACADAAPSPTPTIEYRTPVPTSAFLRPAYPSVVMTLTPPTATEVAETPTPFSLPPTEAPPTPQVFKPAITVPTAFQVSGQSLEKPTPLETVQAPAQTVQADSGNDLSSTLEAAGWPPYLWPWAESIVWRESRGDPSAYNPSGASGLFQIMPQTWAETGCTGDPFAALDNALCAWQLYQAAGVSPWGLN